MNQKDNINKILDKYRSLENENIIEVLHDIQDSLKYLPKISFELIEKRFNISAGKSYSVAKFYDCFYFEKKAKYHIKVCQGTSCHLNKCNEIISKISSTLDVEVGKTSKNQKYSLELVNCIGACAQGPIIAINDKIYTKVSPATIVNILKQDIIE